jgi:ferritin-like metal-binding protein YciE
MTQQQGNLGPTERWISIVSGTGLLLAALVRGGAIGRYVGAAAGLSLLARGTAGHCAMKSALTGETTLREGVRDEWSHLRSRIGGSAADEIDSLEALYFAEMQELHSAETQLSGLLQRLPKTLPNEALARTLTGYGTEVRTRREDLERILRGDGMDPRAHPDDAMKALLRETRKMAQVCSTNTRAAALIASIQRLLHYKIAGYGTVATYAQTLGRIDEASRLAEYSDRDKGLDEELSSIAKEMVNPRAAMQPEGRPGEPVGTRPH